MEKAHQFNRRIEFTIISAKLTETKSAGSGAAGLYGECPEDAAKYICQQILLDTNGRFTFLDYMHLNGKRFNYGAWQQNGDTITLNSDPAPIIQCVYADLPPKEIQIRVIDSSGIGRSPEVYINGIDQLIELKEKTGTAKFPYELIRLLIIRTPLNYFILNFAPGELNNLSKITITLKSDPTTSLVFKDEKWLYRDKALYQVRDLSDTAEAPPMFIKTSLENKRF